MGCIPYKYTIAAVMSTLLQHVNAKNLVSPRQYILINKQQYCIIIRQLICKMFQRISKQLENKRLIMPYTQYFFCRKKIKAIPSTG